MKILIKKYDFFSTEPDCKTLALRTPTPTPTTTTTANKQIKHARTITPLTCLYVYFRHFVIKQKYVSSRCFYYRTRFKRGIDLYPLLKHR